MGTRTRRAFVGVGAVLAIAGFAPAAQGQESTPPPLIFTLPAIPPPTGERTITRDDLRDLPPPRIDRLPSSVSATFIMDDGQCLPGESAAFSRSRRDGRVVRPARPR